MSEIKKEAKLVTHLSENEVGEDVHIIREKIHYPDGTTKRDIKIVKDFKRPFWITKEMYRKYSDKKEAEEMDRVYTFKSTESKLWKSIGPRLGNRYIGIDNPRMLRDSPFVYGVDVDSRTIIKHKYMEKYDMFSPNEVAVLDIEKDILTDDLLVTTIASEKGIFVGVLSKLVWKHKNVKTKLKEMYDKYIPDTDLKKKAELHIEIFPNELDLLKWIFKNANDINVDFVAIWNIDYDIKEIVSTLEKYGVKPEDIMHYDKIPEKYKYFKYNEGTKVKKTASGKMVPKNPEEQWHTVKSSTNFYFIDAMSTHRYVRTGGATVSGGYSLDNILKEEGVYGKLKFDTGGVTQGAEWHIYMVRNKPLEYIIYNIWDTMSMIELDNKTEDLKMTIDLLLGVSHYDVFNSGPKRIVDALFFFYLQNNKVLGTKPMKTTDEKLLSLSNWIITLPGYRIADNGMRNIKEIPDWTTNIRSHVCDADWKRILEIIKKRDFKFYYKYKYLKIEGSFIYYLCLDCLKINRQLNHRHSKKMNCRYCKAKKQWNNDLFLKRARNIHGDTYSYKKIHIINATKKITITCKQHGDFQQAPKDHIYKKAGCPVCGNNKKLSTLDFIEKAKQVHGNLYRYTKVKYINNKTKVIITCKKHEDFQQRPDDHLYSKKGCPVCKESSGEKRIRIELDKLNLNYQQEYKVFDSKLKADFYLPKFNLFIEFNGEQHYKPIEYFGGIESLNKQKIRDENKKNLILKNNSSLLIIKYNKISLIPEKLNFFLKKYSPPQVVIFE